MKSRPKCQHCKKVGHDENGCKLHPEKKPVKSLQLIVEKKGEVHSLRWMRN
jgi:hypothetical protein